MISDGMAIWRWMPDERPAAASQLRAGSCSAPRTRARHGDALVTLYGLTSMPQLNGMVVKLVSNDVAPKQPSSGRIAVRLPDERIISVKVANATPGGVIARQCVSVGGEFQRLDQGDGWMVVVQAFGEVTKVESSRWHGALAAPARCSVVVAQ